MAFGTKIKTEHDGAKHGGGSYYGRKKDAKTISNKKRRQIDRSVAQGFYEDIEE